MTFHHILIGLFNNRTVYWSTPKI